MKLLPGDTPRNTKPLDCPKLPTSLGRYLPAQAFFGQHGAIQLFEILRYVLPHAFVSGFLLVVYS